MLKSSCQHKTYCMLYREFYFCFCPICFLFVLLFGFFFISFGGEKITNWVGREVVEGIGDISKYIVCKNVFKGKVEVRVNRMYCILYKTIK